MAYPIVTGSPAQPVFLVDPTTGLPYVAGGGSGSLPVTIADGADVAEGATTATAYSDATGAAAGTVVGLLKGNYVTSAAFSAKLPASLGAKTGATSLSVVAASDGFNVVATGKEAAGVAVASNPVGIGGKATSSGTPGAQPDGSRVDAAYSQNGWAIISGLNSNGGDGQSNSITIIGNTGNTGRLLGAQGHYYNGTSVDRVRGDVNGMVVQSGLSATFWNYAAAAGGITNTTTAVTIKAAAGGTTRNFLKTLQISAGTLGAATEIAVRDGAAGTVLWRSQLSTAGLGSETIVFDPPLKGTANTLMEFVTLTATITGAVYVNGQGFTGT